MDDQQSIKYPVSPSERGMRLLAFLREKKKEESSVKSLKRAIEAKLCTVNGRVECFSSYILSAGDLVELKGSLETKATLALKILYEDEKILLCNKPSGVISTNESFRSLLKLEKVELVHRLDKETSGVILLAKDPEIKKDLISLFVKRQVKKKYLAVVAGRVEKEEGRIENFLAEKYSYQGQTVYGSAKEGQLAITHWKCLKRASSSSLVLCEPVTGRTHQIRVHLSEMGHPILGDFQYGKERRFPISCSRHLLHAEELSFVHPAIKKEIIIKAPLPEDFTAAQKRLF